MKYKVIHASTENYNEVYLYKRIVLHNVSYEYVVPPLPDRNVVIRHGVGSESMTLTIHPDAIRFLRDMGY